MVPHAGRISPAMLQLAFEHMVSGSDRSMLELYSQHLLEDVPEPFGQSELLVQSSTEPSLHSVNGKRWDHPLTNPSMNVSDHTSGVIRTGPVLPFARNSFARKNDHSLAPSDWHAARDNVRGRRQIRKHGDGHVTPCSSDSSGTLTPILYLHL